MQQRRKDISNRQWAVISVYLPKVWWYFCFHGMLQDCYSTHFLAELPDPQWFPKYTQTCSIPEMYSIILPTTYFQLSVSGFSNWPRLDHSPSLEYFQPKLWASPSLVRGTTKCKKLNLARHYDLHPVKQASIKQNGITRHVEKNKWQTERKFCF